MVDRPVPRPFVINRDVVDGTINEAPIKCPDCGSFDMQRDDIDGTDILTLTWSCDFCGFAWIETYRFMQWDPKE